ncbi:MAG: hypothetical protein A3J27_02830 [Candidatus Tectomicrobia bacterium RIFCSPLOWO2_12_FULL_69_37]|nr:MAG: hypothetical protein A3J27_02830 [Candidatus Tectomicrobia bacterium RIFCSPLOWO2_12_FULL_69_37]
MNSMPKTGWIGKTALLAAAWLLAAAPGGACAMTLAELTKASEVFSDMTQKVLQLAGSAGKRTDQANAEMDRAQGPRLSPEEVQGALGRAGDHLQAARADLQEARREIRQLAFAYQRQLALSRRDSKPQGKPETADEKLILSRYGEAYREAETRSERAYERATLSLGQAEERLKSLKKAKSPAGAPGN